MAKVITLKDPAGNVSYPVSKASAVYLSDNETTVEEALANAGGAKVLTTADYNWPTNSPNGVALWLLDGGIYGVSENVKTYITNSVTVGDGNNKGGIAIVGGRNDGLANIVFLSTNSNSPNPMRSEYIVNKSGGSNVQDLYFLSNKELKNNLTTNTVGYALDANQGRVLKDLVDAKQAQLTAGAGIDITNNVISSIASGATWGNIDGTLANQTDLQNALNAKVNSDLVPEQASTSNQLADKAFVNSTVQTGTANFRGNWDTWANVPTNVNDYPADYTGSKTPTVNDYLVVQDASGYTAQTLSGTWRFKYSGAWSTDGKNGWHPEYQVNETPMTAAQLAAINSGITAAGVTKLNGIADGAEVNVQSDWNQTNTSADDYIKNKPMVGIKLVYTDSVYLHETTDTVLIGSHLFKKGHTYIVNIVCGGWSELKMIYRLRRASTSGVIVSQGAGMSVGTGTYVSIPCTLFYAPPSGSEEIFILVSPQGTANDHTVTCDVYELGTAS